MALKPTFLDPRVDAVNVVSHSNAGLGHVCAVPGALSYSMIDAGAPCSGWRKLNIIHTFGQSFHREGHPYILFKLLTVSRELCQISAY